MDRIWTDGVRGNGYRNRQRHRIHGQEDELSVPLGGNGVLGRRNALRFIRGNLLQGRRISSQRYGDYWGHWINAASFFGGMLLIGMIDNLIPAAENPHETHAEAETMPLHDPRCAPARLRHAAAGESARGEGLHDHSASHQKLMRMGLFTALAIGIHNFPEGLATFLAALQDPHLGVAIAVAIALHNIPEGISVSVPIFYATGNRKKAFVYSLLSGLAEPVGAGIAYLAIRFFWEVTPG